ncbi:MAG: PHB depolymerase family esterase [Acidisphaera sp.]|nr:PHB depolymerase family esterase [Acidisphaera sp.]
MKTASRALGRAVRRTASATGAALARMRGRDAAEPGALTEVRAFGSNPGGLRMLLYAPAHTRAPGAPLIVLLHGCGQQATEFARTAGWFALADRLGVPLLLPEQRSENNRGRCFNWFRPDDARRGGGEALSIRQMVAETTRRLHTDPHRIFLVGLSAGGSMAAALLAGYPSRFAAGAIVAGLPVGAAGTTLQGLARMANAGAAPLPGGWAASVHEAAPPGYAGPWPRISIWHGALDRTVDPANAQSLALQWIDVHGLSPGTFHEVADGGAHRRAWGDPAAPLVETWIIEGMAHGFPIDARRAGCEQARWVLDAGIDGPAAMARFFGLDPHARIRVRHDPSPALEAQAG